MLYNQSTGKPDILSLDSLIGWLETKPSDGKYRYQEVRNCLLAQYLVENGRTEVRVYTSIFATNQDGHVALPEGWNRIASGPLYRFTFYKTYGGALKRAYRLKYGLVGSWKKRASNLFAKGEELCAQA